MKILVINGPNLNFLGIRDKKQYGENSYEYLCEEMKKEGERLGLELEFFQSNVEGLIIDRLQKAYMENISGIVINPGAYTHYSYAIRDCLEVFTCPKVEVHISNIHKREEFRHKSVTALVCDGQICGLGILGYNLALKYISEKLK